jgi:hypothetical protein
VSNSNFHNNSVPNGIGGAIRSSGPLTISSSALYQLGTIVWCLSATATPTSPTNLFLQQCHQPYRRPYNGGSMTLTRVPSRTTQPLKKHRASIRRQQLVVKNSNIFSNVGTGRGGGIFSAGTLVVSDTTFSSNSVANGGGIYNEFGYTVTIASSTFYANSASATAVAYNSGTQPSPTRPLPQILLMLPAAASTTWECYAHPCHVVGQQRVMLAEAFAECRDGRSEHHHRQLHRNTCF